MGAGGGKQEGALSRLPGAHLARRERNQTYQMEKKRVILKDELNMKFKMLI